MKMRALVFHIPHPRSWKNALSILRTTFQRSINTFEHTFNDQYKQEAEASEKLAGCL